MAASSQAVSKSGATGGSIGTDSGGVNYTMIAVVAIIALAVLWWMKHRK
jgi:hypothetical protein